MTDPAPATVACIAMSIGTGDKPRLEGFRLLRDEADSPNEGHKW